MLREGLTFLTDIKHAKKQHNEPSQQRQHLINQIMYEKINLIFFSFLGFSKSQYRRFCLATADRNPSDQNSWPETGPGNQTQNLNQRPGPENVNNNNK